MRRHLRFRHRPRRGFTLIELMVVVVIIALLAAVVLPKVLGRLQKQQDGEAAPVGRIAQAAPSASVVGEAPGALPPIIESSDIRVKLAAHPVLNGVRVHTRYDAAFTGTFVVRNADPEAGELRLHFPFPPAISEARDVSIKLLDEAGQPREAAGATYELDGIRWTGRVAPGDAVSVVVSYSVRGRDAFVYDVAGKSRSEAVRVEVLVDNARTPVVPPDSLQPTELGEQRILWSFNRLVATKPLVVELPAAASPLGQLILLCQLAALAVLLFGGGFWYLSELRRPGSLDGFRWGHFLLLALNYSTFFVTFAVLGYRGQAGVALGVAALVSQPLLALHVARLAGARFALGKVLPLSLATLGTVVAGVYAEAQRPYVFLAVALAAVAYVTFTYRRWAEGRAAHRALRQAELDRGSRELGLSQARKELEQKVDEAAALARRATTLMTEPGDGVDWERTCLQAALAKLEAALQEARLSSGEAPSETKAHQAWVKEGVSAASHHKWLVEGAAGGVSAALGQLEHKLRQAREQAHERATSPKHREGAIHCQACGAALPASTPFCPQCGALGSEVIACSRCSTVLELPRHLLARSWTGRKLHCRACGEVLPTPTVTLQRPAASRPARRAERA